MLQVSVTEINNVPLCSTVYVEPSSVDDWEILVNIYLIICCVFILKVKLV